MLSLRLTRVGKQKAPHFRLIVTEKRRDPWGKHLEILGSINPRSKEANLKEDRITYWLSVGAQPTDSVRNLLIKAGLMKGTKGKSVTITKKRQGKINDKKAQAEEAKKAAAEAAAAAKAAEEEAKKAAEEAAAQAAAAPAEETPAEAPAEAPIETTPEA